MVSPIIMLPFLRPRDNGIKPGKMRYFNPGLSDKLFSSVNKLCIFTPSLPYSAKIAEALLKEMRMACNESAENLVNGLNIGSITQDIGIRQEMEALNAFANGNPSIIGNFNYYLEFAQKMLLWRWHTEQLWEEIESLEKTALKQGMALQKNFEDFPFEDAFFPEKENKHDRLDTGWQKVTENVLFFLSPNIDIYAEPEMARHLIEYLDFKPVREHEELFDLGSGYFYATCPAWQALGYPAGDRFEFLSPYPALADNFIKDRNWIIYGQGF